MAESLQIWFVALWILGIVVIGSIIRFRKYRTQVENRSGRCPSLLGSSTSSSWAWSRLTRWKVRVLAGARV